MRLLVISHTPHYQSQDGISGWGSTVRELDRLAELFDEIVHLAPVYEEDPPESSLPYSSAKIKLVLVKPAGGERFIEKLSIIKRIPAWLTIMRREIIAADVIHIRCPAGISLVSLFAQRFWGRGKPTWIKYAGNWQPNNKEPWSYKFQRCWLKKNLHNGVVTVNGYWEKQPDHVLTFNNPSFSRSEWIQANQAAMGKRLTIPLNLIFVGRVDQAKGVGKVLEIVAGLHEKGIDFHIDLIGDGAERPIYERSLRQLGLAERVSFLGWKNRIELNNYYEKAHFILLPSSSSEGWPKVLSEAMAYGVVPLSTAVSSIPQILSKTQTGMAIPVKETDVFVNSLVDYTENGSRWQRESQNGKLATESFTYEYYLSLVTKMFSTTWNIKLEL